MSDRSAESSIKGYLYQFLHTIKDILERADMDDCCEVEGTEDFDIQKTNEKELIQYKYHEEQKFVNSKVAKPIGIMFNHFLNNKTSTNKYKLFIYLSEEELPDLNKERLMSILKLKSSTDYFDSKNNIYSIASKKHVYAEDETIIESFKNNFEWKLSVKYNDLEQELIELLSNNFSVTQNESKLLFLSNGIKIISDLSIKPNGNRTITKKQFIEELNVLGKIVYSSLILRNKEFNSLKSFYSETKKTLKLNKSNSHYIIEVCNINRINLSQLLVDLSKHFCYKGNKKDIRPITYVVNSEIEDYKRLKRNIFEYIYQQNDLIQINDGHEDYCFSLKIFNEDRIKTLNTGRNKYSKTSYNFRLIHKDIFLENITRFNCFSNIGLFILDNNQSIIKTLSENQFYLNNLTNEQIIEIIGE